MNVMMLMTKIITSMTGETPDVRSDKRKPREERDEIDRVAKCQIFYTEQIFQTKSYPKKSG